MRTQVTAENAILSNRPYAPMSTTLSPLAEKVILVTGAASGLGKAMAMGLAAAGADLAIAAKPESARPLALVREAILAQHPDRRVTCLVIDIVREADCEAGIAASLQEHGRLDALINNAGVGMDSVGPNISQRLTFLDVSVDKWRSIVDTNVNGTFLMTRAVAPYFVRRGRGRIINLSTSFSTMVRQGFAPYGPSKAAVETMTAILAKDLEGTGVTVNALLPGGPADTNMILASDAPDRTKLIAPSIMVPPAIWLVSDAASGFTGKRVIAKDWNPTVPANELAAACANAAW